MAEFRHARAESCPREGGGGQPVLSWPRFHWRLVSRLRGNDIFGLALVGMGESRAGSSVIRHDRRS
jgi:hypothetical protein